MLNIKYLLFFLIITSLFGCKKLEEENGNSIRLQFEVKNSSDYNLRLKLYSSNDSLFKNVEILTSDSLIADEGFLHPAPGGPTYHLTNSLDSAIIEFNDGKKLIQTRGSRGNNDTINNILLNKYYKNFESINSDFSKKQFTIYNNDYLRAQ